MPVLGPLRQIGERDGQALCGWDRPWWPLLAAFSAENVVVDVPKESYDRVEPTWLGSYPHLVYPLDDLSRDLRDGLVELVASLRSMTDLPGNLVFTVGICEQLGEHAQAFFAALSATFRACHGDLSSVHVPLELPGSSDGRFSPHCDMFVPRMLWCTYQKASAVQGATLLIDATTALAHAAELMDGDSFAQLEELLTYRTWRSSGYDEVQYLLYQQSWSGELRDRLVAASLSIHMGPGEGFLTLDGTWLHGRDLLTKPEAGPKRLHRWVFDTESTEATRPVAQPNTAMPDDFDPDP